MTEREKKGLKIRKLTRTGRPRDVVPASLSPRTLAELRKELGVTQADAAGGAAMTQPELSRLERRGDHRLSTLRRYVEGLGGTLEVYALIGGNRIRLREI